MVYCVEDDESIRELVLYALKTDGLEGRGFETGEELLTALKDKLPSLIVLDIMLPGRSGLEILDEIRKNNKYKDIPIILLTAKSTELDKVKGLNKGADDYITKPFSVLEFIARVQAILRRINLDSSDELKLKGVVLNIKSRETFVDNVSVELTYKEFELLRYFLSNINIVISREQIMEEIWGFDFEGESRTVDVHVASLRQKLSSKPGFITTIRNVGYKVSD